MEESEFCQYYYRDLVMMTFPDDRLVLPLRRYWWILKKWVWYVKILGIRSSMPRILPTTRLGKIAHKQMRKKVGGASYGILNLKVGDWVEVRSAKEIFSTLDSGDKLRGLTFTPEMVQYCRRRFKVYKKLDKIILEATGELRKIKTPTVLLEGVFCDGKAHGRCDRSCFCFWREEWLKKVNA